MQRWAFYIAAMVVLGTPAAAQNGQLFVPMQPCRVVDTRGDRTLPSTLVGPPIAGNSVRSFPLLQSPCGIPANATAYSLNLTVVPSGPLIYVTIWPTGQPQPFVSTLNAPGGLYLANAAIVPAGTNGSVSLYASDPTNVILDINGYFVPYVAPTIPPSTTIQQITQQVTQQITQTASLQTILSDISNANYSLGLGTGSAITGNNNTAIGTLAFANNQSGNNNVAIGYSALGSQNSSANIAIGPQSLANFLQGSSLDGQGDGGNVAIGYQSLLGDHTGKNNTAVGTSTLVNSLGDRNIAIGYQAGMYATSSSPSNGALNDSIFIGNSGVADDAQTIRIGTQGTQLRTFISGIFGTNLASNSPQLFVSPSGQLGVLPSSRTTKEQIQTLTDQTTKLMKLRPVQFRYKKAAPDGSKPLQFGLIAEEVDEIYPELVVKDDSGKVVTVAYHQLPALMLKQIQVQQQLIEALQSRVKALENSFSGGTQ